MEKNANGLYFVLESISDQMREQNRVIEGSKGQKTTEKKVANSLEFCKYTWNRMVSEILCDDLAFPHPFQKDNSLKIL